MERGYQRIRGIEKAMRVILMALFAPPLRRSQSELNDGGRGETGGRAHGGGFSVTSAPTEATLPGSGSPSP